MSASVSAPTASTAGRPDLPSSTAVVARPRVARAAILFRVFTLVALLGLGASYFTPIWWVSLKAPNYPAQTFPDGVRIHFHVDRVANGCQMRDSKEVLEKEALDCVSEMDTINHFVGMYPIASGGPVEMMFSGFLYAFLAVILLGFAIPGRIARTAVMTAGFAATAIWMTLALYTPDGVQYMGRNWLSGLVDSLGRSDEVPDEALHPVVRQLKESLAKSGIGASAVPKAAVGATKAQLIDALKTAHDIKAPVSLTEPAPVWSGRAVDVLAWYYAESLGRWFNEPAKNARYVATVRTTTHVLYGIVLAAMAFFLWLAWRPRSPLFVLFPIAGMVLPLVFLVVYSAWLWWYGHTLNPMGAFTLKPFMPTVFGDGKVAQFSTHSYPHVGFALMCVVAAAMAVAAVLRRSLPAAAKD